MAVHLWVRHETRETERRTPLIPADARRLVDLGFTVTVERSPQRIFEIDAIRTLSDAGTIVVCAGGGGIPTMREPDGSLRGVEAVIDKDLCSAKLAEDLDADLLIIATDVDGVYEGWGTTGQRRIASASPGELEQMGFAAGSMGPKVMAASGFAQRTGNRAMIGSLDDIADLVEGTAGTAVTR